MVWNHLASYDFIAITLACLVIVAIHIWYHLKSNGKTYLLIRTLLLLVGLAGLIMLYLQPKKSYITPAKNIVLETNSEANTSEENKTIHEILNSNLQYDTVIIKGDGLSQEELALLDSFHLKFIPRKKIVGFSQINIPKIKEGQAWVLDGKVNPEEIKNVELIQSDGTIRKAEVDREGMFQLNITSGNKGNFTYELKANYQDTSITEQIPVEVLPSEKWDLLAYSAAPSFELNYLKNYWVKQGNGFSLKQKVSQDRFKETFLNNPKINLDKINTETLRKFNFLMLDSDSWNGLKDAERNLALNYVASGRIGLLFFGLEKGDKLSKINGAEVIAAEEKLLSSNNVKIEQLSLAGNFKNLRSSESNTAAIRRYGLGSIAIMAINDTYRFILADQSTSFQNIWANVFSEIYIAPSASITMRSSPWNLEGEASIIDIFSRKELDDTAILNEKAEVAIKQTAGQEGLYYVNTKANPGWNTLVLEESKTEHKFFVHDNDSWQAMRQAHLHKINTQAAAQTKELGEKVNIRTETIPFYWGLIISLIGFGGLWIHERMYT